MGVCRFRAVQGEVLLAMLSGCPVGMVLAASAIAPATQPAKSQSAVPTPPDPTLNDSSAARAATSKYQREREQADKDYETRLHQMRQEYEIKTTAARKAYITALEVAQADETRKAKLELALAIKGAIARLKAEVTPVWPQQALPAPPPPAIVETAKPATAPNPAVASKAPAKPVDATHGHRFDFSNEKMVREEWTLPIDSAKWQLADGGVTIKTDKLASRFTLHGDCSIALQYVLADYAHCWLTVCGEEIPLPEARKKVIEVLIERKGGIITLTSTLGGNKTFKIKDAALEVPTALNFRVTRDIGIKAIIVKTKELART